MNSLTSRRAVVLVGGLAALLAGCCSSRECAKCSDHAAAVTPATDAQRTALIERVKGLKGEWTSADEQGNQRVVCRFDVSSNGSVVREIMFPGGEHEMTNVYHMDGDSLVMTHYCARGNQPRMRAHAADGNEIVFVNDGVTNLTEKGGGYMGGMTLVFKDENTVIERWQSYRDGKASNDHNTEFVLTRKK